MNVGSLRIYPVKSTGGLQVEEAIVERAGLAGDRRWAVVDTGGNYLTARTHPLLLSVTATPDRRGGLCLTAAGHDPLAVPAPVDGPHIGVRFSGLNHAIDAGDAAAAWFGDHLGEAVRLVWQDDPHRRPVDPDHGGLPGDPLSLADAGPLLLTTTASLARLGEWLVESGSTITMLAERLRPNVVVDGDLEPFTEDGWSRLRIAGVDFRFADHCDRCVLTTVDPAALERGPEPIRTLSRHRRSGGKTWFGIWIVPLSSGRIKVGDTLEIQRQ